MARHAERLRCDFVAVRTQPVQSLSSQRPRGIIPAARRVHTTRELDFHLAVVPRTRGGRGGVAQRAGGRLRRLGQQPRLAVLLHCPLLWDALLRVRRERNPPLLTASTAQRCPRPDWRELCARAPPRSPRVEILPCLVSAAEFVRTARGVQRVSFHQGDMLQSPLDGVSVVVLASQCWDRALRRRRAGGRHGLLLLRRLLVLRERTIAALLLRRGGGSSVLMITRRRTNNFIFLDDPRRWPRPAAALQGRGQAHRGARAGVAGGRLHPCAAGGGGLRGARVDRHGPDIVEPAAAVLRVCQEGVTAAHAWGARRSAGETAGGAWAARRRRGALAAVRSSSAPARWRGGDLAKCPLATHRRTRTTLRC